MGVSLRKNPDRRDAYAYAIELTQHVHHQNIEYVACATFVVRPRTGVKLLRHLLVDSETPYLRGNRDSHFCHTFDGGCDHVHIVGCSGTEIDRDRLPRSGSLFNGNFDADCIREFHLMLSGFQAECEIVKAQLQDLREPPKTFGAVTGQAEIEVPGGTRCARVA